VWVNLARLTEAGGSAPQVATLHIFVNPLVSWIWAGGLLFLLGAVVAAWPQPRRQRAAVPATDRKDVPA
jgi:cytochrome c-type biogenesis protein CcmF